MNLVSVEGSGEFLGREETVALDYEVADLVPVRLVCESHPEAIAMTVAAAWNEIRCPMAANAW